MSDVTRLLESLREGDERAADGLLQAVYDELRRIAARKLAGERAGQTLQATALVHEAYIRLVGKEEGARGVPWKGRAYFFAAAAEAMRRILIERARRRARMKHGGGRERVGLEEVEAALPPDSIDILALDEALERFAAQEPTKAELVKLRFFAGLEQRQAAEVLGISKATADRHWAFARAWLYDAMRDREEPPTPPSS